MRTFNCLDGGRLSTYRGGGVVKATYIPESAAEFSEAAAGLKTGETPPYVLGGGSNTLIADGEISRPVLSTEGLNGLEFCENRVVAESGVRLPALLSACGRQGLGGLDFLVGVPGTVGGAVRMNAGAYSAETADYLTEITILTEACEIKRILKKDVAFGYRQGASGIILSATFELTPLDAEEILKRRNAYLAKRNASQPKYPSLGSVFKRADKPAGWYIENVGLKGMRVGGAEISTLHANFIVNVGGGSAEDYLSLVKLAENRVYENYGVRLEREFVLLGDGEK